MTVVIMQLYRYELMDHYKNPRNHGLLVNADFVSREHNPSCGDAVTVSGQCKDGILVAVGFEGVGCVISLAAASLLFEFCKNKSCAEIATFDKDIIVRLLGIDIGPTRLRCALLPLQALQQGVRTVAERI